MADTKTPRSSRFDRDYNEADYNEMLKMYEGTLGTISEGEIVRGRVVAIGGGTLAVAEDRETETGTYG